MKIILQLPVVMAVMEALLFDLNGIVDVVVVVVLVSFVFSGYISYI